MSTPPTTSAPSSFFAALVDHRWVTSALGSSGTWSHAGPRAPSAWAHPASCARISSHPFRRRDTEQVQAVGQHGAGGVDQPEARLVQRRDRTHNLTEPPALACVVTLVQVTSGVHERA